MPSTPSVTSHRSDAARPRSLRGVHRRLTTACAAIAVAGATLVAGAGEAAANPPGPIPGGSPVVLRSFAGWTTDASRVVLDAPYNVPRVGQQLWGNTPNGGPNQTWHQYKTGTITVQTLLGPRTYDKYRLAYVPIVSTPTPHGDWDNALCAEAFTLNQAPHPQVVESVCNATPEPSEEWITVPTTEALSPLTRDHREFQSGTNIFNVGYLGAGQSLTGAQVLTAGTTPGHAVDGEGIELEPQAAPGVLAHGQFWDVNPTTSQATFNTFGYSTPAALLAPGDSNLVLDIPYASTAPNTQIMTFYENSGDNQQWVFDAVGTTSINVPVSWTGSTPSTTTNPLQVPVFKIRSKIGTCLDATGQTPSIGAPVTSQPCDIGGLNQANQSWVVLPYSTDPATSPLTKIGTNRTYYSGSVILANAAMINGYSSTADYPVLSIANTMVPTASSSNLSMRAQNSTVYPGKTQVWSLVKPTPPAPQEEGTSATCAGYGMLFGCASAYFFWVDSWSS